MSILNQKEEVLKVELTKHGRKILGMGVFKPKYFSFHDDSIIYDNMYSGVQTEDTNLIQGRLLDESLTFSYFNLLSDDIQNEIGKSDHVNKYSPAWDIKLLNGKMTLLPELSSYYKKIFTFEKIYGN